MKNGTRIVLAVGFGYLVGRRKKLRTVLTLAAAAAMGRAAQQPGGLRKVAAGLLDGDSQLAGLGKLGAPLGAAGKAAVTAAAGSGIDALSGKLRTGAESLRRGPDDRRQGDGQRYDEPEDEDLYEDEDEDDEQDEEQPASKSSDDRVGASARRRRR